MRVSAVARTMPGTAAAAGATGDGRSSARASASSSRSSSSRSRTLKRMPSGVDADDEPGAEQRVGDRRRLVDRDEEEVRRRRQRLEAERAQRRARSRSRSSICRRDVGRVCSAASASAAESVEIGSGAWRAVAARRPCRASASA